MSQNNDFVISRILSNKIRCRINNNLFVIQNPTADIKYEAEEIYQDALNDAMNEGMMTRDDLVIELIRHGLWSLENEKFLENLPGEIEDLKVKLFESTFKSKEREAIRKGLSLLRTRMEGFYMQKYALDYNSCESYAGLCKNYFILEKTLYCNNNPIHLIDGNTLDEIASCVSSTRLSEKQIRELSRSEQWRSLWSLRGVGVFDVPLSCFTEEQKSLCLWSKMYDNINESPDLPSDDVINDDDMLDGWLIIQRRKRDAELKKKAGESFLGSDKSKNADEVYIVVDSIEDARKVESMNNTMGKIKKAQRNQMIKEKGVVSEQQLPDRVQQRLLGG